MILDEPKRELTRRQKRVRLAVKLILSVAALFGLGLVILGNIGGDSEPLRLGAEDYLLKSTRMKPAIGRFGGVHFYPDVVIDMGEISLSKPQDEKPAVTVGSVLYKMGFWDLFLSRHRIRTFEIKKARFRPGVTTSKELYIERAKIEALDQSGKAALTVWGTYGGKSFTGSLQMSFETEPYGEKLFSVPPNPRYAFTSSFLKSSGTMSLERTGYRIRMDSLETAEAKLLNGTALLQNNRDNSALHLDINYANEPAERLDFIAETYARLYCLFDPPQRPLNPSVQSASVSTAAGQTNKSIEPDCRNFSTP